jgi:hypothetical protein
MLRAVNRFRSRRHLRPAYESKERVEVLRIINVERSVRHPALVLFVSLP